MTRPVESYGLSKNKIETFVCEAAKQGPLKDCGAKEEEEDDVKYKGKRKLGNRARD
jgi:hypothetical protein